MRIDVLGSSMKSPYIFVILGFVLGPDCLAVQWPKQIAEDLKDSEDLECRAL